MTVWAIADLHLALGVPEKNMDVFGEVWHDYAAKIKRNWEAVVSEDDLVLVAGDISWAMRLEEAKVDLDWIGALPGTKVFIKGNHDYWWHSPAKVRSILPPSCHIIQNDAFLWNGIGIAGTRLWDSDAFDFNAYIDFSPRPISTKEETPDRAKIYQRELHRLELSLKALPPEADIRLAMTHYPPLSADLAPSPVTALLEQYHISACVFGHLHSLKKNASLFGTKEGIRYLLTSADYLDFKPTKIL